MRIILISEYNSLTSTGGTEAYLDRLVHILVKNKHEVIVLSQGKNSDVVTEKEIFLEEDKYLLLLIPYKGYTIDEIKLKRVSYTWGFMEPIITSFRPDVVHAHTNSTFFNMRHFERCKAAGLNNLVFTTHIPEHLCSTGNLIKHRKKPCNGKIGVQCIPCLFFYGLKRGVAGILKNYYNAPLDLLATIKELKIQLVCVSEWQKKLIVLNGFPGENVSVIRQAIYVDKLIQAEGKSYQQLDVKFRIGFLGRFVPEKGSSLLLDIIELLKNDDRFHFVLGIPPTSSDTNEMEKLYAIVSRIPDKITVLDSITPDNKNLFYQQIDCLLIPSFFWETGPIVLLEALAFQKPVIGVDLAGIAEYKKEFPTVIRTFQWGDANDAVTQLVNLAEYEKNEFNDAHVTERLIEKEKEFSDKHIGLYQYLIRQSDTGS